MFQLFRRMMPREENFFEMFARHAEVLGPTPQAQAEIRAGRYKLAFLDYDWALNDAR